MDTIHQLKWIACKRDNDHNLMGGEEIWHRTGQADHHPTFVLLAADHVKEFILGTRCLQLIP